MSPAGVSSRGIRTKHTQVKVKEESRKDGKKRRVVVGTIGRGGSSHIQLVAVQKELPGAVSERSWPPEAMGR